jgi:hypothetical protein
LIDALIKVEILLFLLLLLLLLVIVIGHVHPNHGVKVNGREARRAAATPGRPRGHGGRTLGSAAAARGPAVHASVLLLVALAAAAAAVAAIVVLLLAAAVAPRSIQRCATQLARASAGPIKGVGAERARVLGRRSLRHVWLRQSLVKRRLANLTAAGMGRVQERAH